MKHFLVAMTASLLSTSPVLANDNTTTFSVGATITNACAVAASDLAFGAIDTLRNARNPSDASATINVTCANGTLYGVALDAGSSATGARAMSGDSDTLEYALYGDAGHSSHRGNAVEVAAVADTGTGTGATQTLTVYGRVVAGRQTTPTGRYSDKITVTITY